MANRELNFSGIIFLAILCGIMSIIFGCASTATPRKDSNHYRAEAQVQSQVYPCPKCDFLIPMEEIKVDIREKNECSNCKAEFPYLESSNDDRGGNSYQDKEYQGPKVFGRGFYSDIKHDNKVEYSFKNSWKVSPDGDNGSISSTTIRSYEHSVDGEYGTLVGPGAHYGYGY